MQVTVQRAVPADVPGIEALVELYAAEHLLLRKPPRDLYGDLDEFVVARDGDGWIIGCGALHVTWAELGEVRTLAVHPRLRGRGVGHAMLTALEGVGRAHGLTHLFCLTFAVEFFAKHGFVEIGEGPALIGSTAVGGPGRSSSDSAAATGTITTVTAATGTIAALDLARAKPNTLGNTRMLKSL